MTAFVLETPSEPTDASLPDDYRDSQMNAGTLLAIDFGYARCAPADAVADSAPGAGAIIRNLLDGGQDAALVFDKSSPTSSAAYTLLKRLKLRSKILNAGTATDRVLLSTQSKFNIKGSTQFAFGFTAWLRVNSEEWFPHGVGNSLVGMSYSGAYGTDLTPMLITIEKRRRAVTVDPATDVITLAAHGLASGKSVEVNGTALPGGTVASTRYYVINPTTDTFQISATPGGAALDLTSAGTSPYIRDDAFFVVPRGDLGTLMVNGSFPDVANYPGWLMQPDTTFQVAFGWSVKDGVATQEALINGGNRIALTSTVNLTLPESGFDNIMFGFGQTPAVGVSGGAASASQSLYRTQLENFATSGRTLTAMAQGDYTANSAAIFARG